MNGERMKTSAPNVQQWLANQDRALLALLATVVVSFAFWGLAIGLGFDDRPQYAPATYRTYFELYNWWPYPFFFLALAPVLWLTWKPFLDVWPRLAGTGVLHGPDGTPDDAAIDAIRVLTGRWRRWAIFMAFLIAVFVNVVDRAPVIAIYGSDMTFSQRLEFTCEARIASPDAFVKWLYDDRRARTETPCNEQGPETPALGADRDSKSSAPPAAQLLFVAIAWAQQFLIVLFSALAVIQVLLHTLVFAVFDRLEIARIRSLRLDLNGSSPLNEFGLEHWNYTLNNFYWAVCPALLGVFLSRAATPPADYAPGQQMLGIAVPAILILPMIATVIVRQARLPRAWSLLKPEGQVDPEDFRRQQLWPLDRNWSSKLGILLAFALAALSLGMELSQFVTL